MTKSCLVIRDGAMGDVILTTPIIERLALDYPIIDVVTKCGAVFANNLLVRQVSESKLHCDYDKIIDLNLAYERRPKMHIIDAYSLVAFGDTNTPHICKLYEPDEVKEDYICIHRGGSWQNRTWPESSWNKLEHLLLEKYPVHSFAAKVEFWELVSLIKKAKLFVGMDSGPLHIAQAVDTPSIGLYTCANPEYRMHGYSNWTIEPEIECRGCLHEEKPPVTYCGCKRGDFKCLELITPEIVFERIKGKLEWMELQKTGFKIAPIWKGPMPKYPAPK